MDIEQLRAQTPGCARRIHLNNAGAGLMTRATLQAMRRHLELEATIGGYEAAEQAEEAVADTYRALAQLIGGRPQELALFDNSTRAWNAAFHSVQFRPGDRVVTGRAEYGSNVLSYLQLARRLGVEVVVVPNDGQGQIDVEALGRAVDERTRLIGLSHIPTGGGLVNPAEEVGRIARAAGALFLLDATQSAGQLPLDVERLGCDLLTGTGRKFLRGPRGTGFLWVREAVLERLDPSVVEIEAATWDGARGFTWAPGARRFESWERSYVNVLGLGSAVRQALALGMEAIWARDAMLGDRLRRELELVPGVSTHDLGRVRCAIVTARVEGVAAQQVRRRLAEAGINVTTTVAEHSPFDTEERGVHPLVRLSPHYYNTEDELSEAVRVVSELARS